jgi:hypothetical protein
MDLVFFGLVAVVCFFLGYETGKKHGMDDTHKTWESWLERTNFSAGDEAVIRATAPRKTVRHGKSVVQ